MSRLVTLLTALCLIIAAPLKADTICDPDWIIPFDDYWECFCLCTWSPETDHIPWDTIVAGRLEIDEIYGGGALHDPDPVPITLSWSTGSVELSTSDIYLCDEEENCWYHSFTWSGEIVVYNPEANDFRIEQSCYGGIPARCDVEYCQAISSVSGTLYLYSRHTWHVATTGDDITGDGSADHPFRTIARGIEAAADGDSVIVAPGTYTGDGNRDLGLLGKAIVLRSSTGQPSDVIIDCDGSPGDPHCGFYLSGGEGHDTVIEGFTITDGVGWGDTEWDGNCAGGAIWCGSSPTIKDCVLTGNSSDCGSSGIYCEADPIFIGCEIAGNGPGGIYLEAYAGNPQFVDCDIADGIYIRGSGTFQDCRITQAGLEGYYCYSFHVVDCVFSNISGSAVRIDDASFPTFTGCVFEDNTGYGIDCNNDGKPIVTDCVFRRNQSGGLRLGLFVHISNSVFEDNGNPGTLGGGLSIGTISPSEPALDGEIVGCFFEGNTAAKGGGIYIEDMYGIFGALTLSGCLIVDNSAAMGSGIYLDVAGGGDPTSIDHCTIAGNSGGDAIHVENIPGDPEYQLQIGNSIVAFNQDGQSMLIDAAVDLSIACTDMFGNSGGNWPAPFADQLGVNGNIYLDPFFCDAAGGDYSLWAVSPCAPANSGGCGLIGALDADCQDGHPGITAVEDLPGDQGGQVRISWDRCDFDVPESDYPITDYSIWRRIDEAQGEKHAQESGGSAGRLSYPPGDWDFVTSVPARAEETYNTVVPTVCDSTDAGLCYSVFFVSAITEQPWIYFDSLPDSGYSVDNLAPAVPSNLDMLEHNLLSWEAVPDEDFDYYRVYVSDDEEFGDYEELGTSVETSFEAAGSEGRFLAVSATDFSGNEGGISDPYYNWTAAQQALPRSYALHPNAPNPFNPSTRIRFDLPEAGEVSLRIYDLAGRVVSSLLVDERREAGSHSVTWRGVDDTGRSMASGIYFGRLEASGFSQTRKMTLLK